jgi:hypothetical protein
MSEWQGWNNIAVETPLLDSEQDHLLQAYIVWNHDTTWIILFMIDVKSGFLLIMFKICEY